MHVCGCVCMRVCHRFISILLNIDSKIRAHIHSLTRQMANKSSYSLSTVNISKPLPPFNGQIAGVMGFLHAIPSTYSTYIFYICSFILHHPPFTVDTCVSVCYFCFHFPFFSLLFLFFSHRSPANLIANSGHVKSGYVKLVVLQIGIAMIAYQKPQMSSTPSSPS